MIGMGMPISQSSPPFIMVILLSFTRTERDRAHRGFRPCQTRFAQLPLIKRASRNCP